MIIFIAVFFSLSLVSAAMDPAPPFCEHQGYKIERTGDNVTCVFDDGKSCEIREFYQGTCGKEYRREQRCVPLGEPVFEYDRCCQGAPYLPQGYIGQATCRHFSERITISLLNPWTWTMISVFAFFIAVIYGLYRLIYFIVKKNSKK